jgi:hypothetical protein
MTKRTSKTKTAIALPAATELEEMPLNQVINSIYPLAQEALEQATTAKETNEVRRKIEAIVGYVNRRLPAEFKGRKKVLKRANKGNDLYLYACREAGAMWDVIEHHKGRPPAEEESVKELSLSLPTLTAQQAGFVDRFDARRCQKASKVDEEDYRTYKTECDSNGRQYTLTGLVNVYDAFNQESSEEGGEVSFYVGNIVDRMTTIRKKLESVIGDLHPEWEPEQKLLETAFKKVQAAIESAMNRDIGEPAVIEEEIA